MVGEKRVCINIDGVEEFLVRGVIYKIEAETENSYSVICIDGKIGTFNKTYFADAGVIKLGNINLMEIVEKEMQNHKNERYNKMVEEIKSRFADNKTVLKDSFSINQELKFHSCRSRIMDVTEIKLGMLQELHEEQQKLFEIKNRKYDDSFAKTFKEYGNAVLCIRLDDKLQRVKSLLLKGEKGTNDESILDTLQDLASYANMAIIELKLERDEEVERRR